MVCKKVLLLPRRLGGPCALLRRHRQRLSFMTMLVSERNVSRGHAGIGYSGLLLVLVASFAAPTASALLSPGLSRSGRPVL
jgi:hypothetical protein